MTNHFSAILFIFLMITAALVSIDAQTNDEPIRIQTSASEIGLTIPADKRKSLNFEVFDNGIPADQIQVDYPENSRVQIYLLISFNPDNKLKFSPDLLLDELKKLEKTTKAEIVSVNIVEDQKRHYRKVKLPKRWNVTYSKNLQDAVTSQSNALKFSDKPLKSLLLLTNSVSGLPVDVIERVDRNLVRESAMVYLMNINELPAVKDAADLPVISRTNINGVKLIVNRSQYLAAMFRSFAGLIATYHKVSFRLPESEENKAIHKIQVFVKDKPNSNPICRNERLIGFPEQTSAPEETVAKEVNAVLETPASVSAVTVRDEFTPIQTATSDRSRLFLSTQLIDELTNRLPAFIGNQPVLEIETARLRSQTAGLYRALGTNIPLFVYDSDKVEAKGMNGFLIAVSAKTIAKIKNPELLNAIIAHEIAHVYFAEEYQRAYKTANYERIREIELECDVVAVGFMETAGFKTKSYLTALKKMAKHLPEHADVSTHPTLAVRIERVQKHLKSGALAANLK